MATIKTVNYNGNTIEENENKYQREDRDSLSMAALVKPSRNESVGPGRGRRSVGCKRKEGEALQEAFHKYHHSVLTTTL